MINGTFMKPREFTEQWEAEQLCEYASLSSSGMGRKYPEAKCDYRTEFQRDRDRITHSTAFRRLSHKTQVFISPDGDHYRTRLSHTLEVAQVSRTIARALRLNEDLTEAIALGHDLGHTPFGHTGEDALNAIAQGGFRHYEQSARILEELNLTGEVLDGVFNHSSVGCPGTLEGKIVQLSDKIAYVNHDIDDAIRAGLMKEDDVPEECSKLLGSSGSSRINFLVSNIINASMGKNFITLDPEPKQLFSKLRDFMFETVYTNQLVQSEREKISHMIGEIYSYFMKNNNELPTELIKDGKTIEKAVVDHIARMTDRYAIKIYTKIAMPESWRRSIL